MEQPVFEIHWRDAQVSALFYAAKDGNVSVVFSKSGKKVRTRPAPWDMVKPLLMYLRPKTTECELSAIQGMLK